jgi:hypothetical protein
MSLNISMATNGLAYLLLDKSATARRSDGMRKVIMNKLRAAGRR